MVANVIKLVIEAATSSSYSVNSTDNIDQATLLPTQLKGPATVANTVQRFSSTQSTMPWGSSIDSGIVLVKTKFWRYYSDTVDSINGVSHKASQLIISSWSQFFSTQSSPEETNSKSIISVRHRSNALHHRLCANHNLYNAVTGRGGVESHLRPSTADTVRQLLRFVSTQWNVGLTESEAQTIVMPRCDPYFGTSNDSLNGFPNNYSISKENCSYTLNQFGGEYCDGTGKISNAENSSRLAMGTIRALRDLILDEALELHSSLRYWTNRWENPILSLIEAGPLVWFSQSGYNHQALVGEKVAQIQAVLARRCASIGELQQHLLRAGWERGILRWGALGEGNEWAAVVGGSGEIDFENRGPKVILPKKRMHTNPSYYAEADFVVAKRRGGEIEKNEAALAAWSVDAIRIVRDQLYGAGDNTTILPHYMNWPQEKIHFAEKRESPYTVKQDSQIIESFQAGFKIFHKSAYLPIWAASISSTSVNVVTIVDLQCLAQEVSDLLDSMEVLMQQQRERRLEKLKQPSLLIRNWYVVAIVIPLSGYVTYKLVTEQKGSILLHEIWKKLGSFCDEHIFDPLKSIYRELFTRKGREEVTDRKARLHTIEILKKMLQSWYDEFCPGMTEVERKDRANVMDMSLIEQRKEDSIKNILELNNIVRMSLIEMQFIKKELMNALYSMDELIGSNEINVKLAAMTPAFLLFSFMRFIFRFFFYALLKLGKSKEETYASFRLILLNIERLLVMRDNPPIPPPPLSWAEGDLLGNQNRVTNDGVLSAEDLGMLMLLVHECRYILWHNRRRFYLRDLRHITEDLSELTGERGAVSIGQQLHILSRMYRTYSFFRL